MRPWVVALLDPSPIEVGTKDKSHATIESPPPFKITKEDKMFPAPGLPSTLRKRDLRSASPSKSNTPRKIATPRKRRTKGNKLGDESARNARLENGTASVEPTPSVASESHADDVVRLEVDEKVEKENGVETVSTKVTIEMPPGNPDLALPETAEGVLEMSHEIVAAARQLEGSKARKRKVDEIEEEPEQSSAGPVVSQPARKQRKLEEQLKTERVKARALIGITTTVALAYVVSPRFASRC